MSFSSGHEALRADYVLSFRTVGADAALRADRAIRDGVGQTSRAVTTATTLAARDQQRQAEAWRQTQRVVEEATRRVSQAQANAAGHVDRSVMKIVALKRKEGESYQQIGKYLEAYKVNAGQAAAAVERSAAREVAALERVETTRKRLKAMVGLGPPVAGGHRGGAQVEAASAGRGVLRGASEHVRRATFGMGGFVAGGLAGFISTEGIKSAIENTTELAHESEILSTVIGGTRDRALEFVTVASAMGVSSKSLGMGFRTLGQQTTAALTNPTKQTTLAFRELGISHSELVAHQHDLIGMMGLVSDRLKTLPPGAERVALSAKLMGRNWQSMAPLLQAGSKGMDDMLNSAKAAGVEMGGHSAEQTLKLHEAMIQLKIAQSGVEMQFVQHILPALLKVMAVGLKLYGVVRTNLAPVFHFLGTAIHDASTWLKEHKTVLEGVKIALTGVVAGFVALKVISSVVRLVRGLTADFKSAAGGVSSFWKLITGQARGQSAVESANAKIAASNAELSASYDELTASARAAREAQGLAPGGAVGMPGMAAPALGGGAARTAEGVLVSDAAKAEAVLPAVQQYGASGAMFGAAGGRQISMAAANVASRTPGGVLLPAGVRSIAPAATAEVAGAGLAGAEVASTGRFAALKGLAGGAGGAMMFGLLGNQLGGMLGGAVGGKKGAGFGSAIGTGAGIGMAFGPEGALIGAGGAAAIKGLQTLVGGSSPNDTVKKIQQQMADAVNRNDWRKLQQLGEQAQKTAKGLSAYDQGDAAGKLQKLATAAEAASRSIPMQQAAKQIQGPMQILAQGQHGASAEQITTATVASLAKLPGQAQRVGAEAMVKFAAELEDKGKLAKGTTDKLIKDLTDKYGTPFQQRLAADANDSMRAIQNGFAQSKVLGTTQQQVQAIELEWGLMVPHVKVTAQNYAQSVGSEMKAMSAIVKSEHGKARAAAEHELAALQRSSSQHWQLMLQDTTARQKAMTKQIADGSAQARDAATQNWGTLATNVKAAVASGAIGVAEGNKIINQDTTALLQALGAAPLPKIAGVSPAQVRSAVNAGQGLAAPGKGTHAGLNAATGARVPGPVGPDNWLLVDPSGVPRAAVGGAELLIANRHTEARVDSKLALGAALGLWGPSSLGSEVAGETQLHSFAAGGRVGFSGVVSTFGPPGEAAGSTAYGKSSADPGISLRIPGTGWDDPRNRALMGHVFRVSIQGHNANLMDIDLGPADWTGRNIDVTGAGVAALGIPFATFPTGAVGNVAELGAGALTTVGGAVAGALGAAPTIQAPVVRGSGTPAVMARAAFKKEVAAANALIAQQFASQGGGGGTGNVSLLPGQHRHEAPTGGAALRQMIAEANAIASHNYNYEWGGGHGALGVPSHGSGHGSGPGVGFDCSGAVSAVLGAGGLLNSPLVASDFMSWGQAGPGRQVSIWASPSHTFMSLAGHYFGTSTAENPGGGANWMPYFPESLPSVRHPPGYATGGRVVQQTTGRGWQLDESQLPPEERSRRRRNPAATLPGLALGGLARAATGVNLGLGYVTAPSTSTHHASAPTMRYYHHQPVGVMTTPQWQAWQAAHATTHTRGPAGAKPTMRYYHHRPVGVMDTAQWQAWQLAHAAGPKARKPPSSSARWDPFTNSYKLLTAAQYRARVYLPYFRRYHKPPPTHPASAHHQTLASTPLPLGPGAPSFELGYQFGLDPFSSNATSPTQALTMALSGVSGATALYGGPLTPFGRSRAAHAPSWLSSGLTRYLARGGRLPRAARGWLSPGLAKYVWHGSRSSMARGRGTTAPPVEAYYEPLTDWALDPSLGYGEPMSEATILGESGGASVRYAAAHITGMSTAPRTSHALVGSLRSVERGGSQQKVNQAMTAFSKTLDNVSGVSYDYIQRLHDTLAKANAKAKPGSAAQKRLAQAMALTDYEMGKRTGALVSQAEAQTAALQTASTRLQRLMTRKGIDAASAQGAQMVEQFDAQAVKVLQNSAAMLRTALAHAKKIGDKTAVKDISDKLTSTLDSLDQAVTDAVTSQVDAVGAAVTDITTKIQKAGQAQTDWQTILGVADTSAGAAQRGQQAQTDIGTARGELSFLTSWRASLKPGQDALRKAIDDATGTIVTTLADGYSRMRQSITDGVNADIATGQKVVGRAQTWQTLLGSAGTVGGDQQMAALIKSSVIDPMTAELNGPNGLIAKYNAAIAAGDTGTASTLSDAIDTVASTIAQGMTDMKTALEDAAQKLSDAAQAQLDTANAGADLLTSEQNLAGSGPQGLAALAAATSVIGQIPGMTLPTAVQQGSTPQAQAQLGSYIQSTVLPAIAGQLRADRANYEDALKRGDTDAAAQYLKQIRDEAKAYYDESAQALTDINASTAQTASNTQTSGQLGVSYQSEAFPVLAGMMNGA